MLYWILLYCTPTILYCTVLHYTVLLLYCTILHYAVLDPTVLYSYYTVLGCTALYCTPTVLHYTALCCTSLVVPIVRTVGAVYVAGSIFLAILFEHRGWVQCSASSTLGPEHHPVRRRRLRRRVLHPAGALCEYPFSLSPCLPLC
jgi:hypothetical protein